MDRRLQLQQTLESILGSGNVYFQPPPNIQMQYPCIVYKRDRVDIDYAGNKPYLNRKRYTVTVMDTDPDSDIPDKVASLQTASFNRHFTADNLNHDVYTLYA